MTTVKVDAEEVRQLAVDMRRVGVKMGPQVQAIVAKAAVNIKADLTAQLKASRHFKGFADVSYDLFAAGFGAEIGPTKGGAGAGANLAYFGTSRGGGTVEEPAESLKRETTQFERWLASIAEKALT